MDNEIMEKVIQFLDKENSKGSEPSFDEIWSAVAGKDSSNYRLKSEVFTAMLQNVLIINIGNDKWKLRKYVSFEDYKRNKASMFGLERIRELEELRQQNSAEDSDMPLDDEDVMEEEILEPIIDIDEE
jgi:DNA-directed RNA polymerase delta subunit